MIKHLSRNGESLVGNARHGIIRHKGGTALFMMMALHLLYVAYGQSRIQRIPSTNISQLAQNHEAGDGAKPEPFV